MKSLIFMHFCRFCTLFGLFLRLPVMFRTFRMSLGYSRSAKTRSATIPKTRTLIERYPAFDDCVWVTGDRYRTEAIQRCYRTCIVCWAQKRTRSTERLGIISERCLCLRNRINLLDHRRLGPLGARMISINFIEVSIGGPLLK